MFKARTLTTMAVLSALSIVLVLLIHFPIFPGAPFLEYDPADIPILIGAFLYGPLAGVAMTVIVSVLQGLTVSAQSGLYGIIMHIVATGSFVLVAGLIYKQHKTRVRAAVSLGVGVLVVAPVMAMANLFVTPLFMGVPQDAVIDMLFPIIIPFNLIKFTANAVVTFAVYKAVSRLAHFKEGAARTR